MSERDLDAFTRQYIATALWASSDDDDTPLDDNYGIEDIAEPALARMIEDCGRFQQEQASVLDADGAMDYRRTAERAGHDFWLTRNRHGAGFWDGDWPEPMATQLTDAAHAFGECDLYVGDDGKVWAS